MRGSQLLPEVSLIGINCRIIRSRFMISAVQAMTQHNLEVCFGECGLSLYRDHFNRRAKISNSTDALIDCFHGRLPQFLRFEEDDL